MKAKLIEIIKQIRKETNLDISDNKVCRHCIDIREKDAMVSYLFSLPVRREKDGVLCETYWGKRGKTWEAEGAMFDVRIKVSCDKIILSQPRKSYTLILPCQQSWKERDNELYSENMRISLNPNGVTMSCNITDKSIKMQLQTDRPIYEVRGNGRYFAFMSQRFKPGATISALYFKGKGDTFYPVKLSYDKVDIDKYELEWEFLGESQGEFVFEYNLYEEKLFQDTTVSEAFIWENNVFGTTAFLGRSKTLGEERLYIKPRFDLLNQYRSCDIQSILLLIPKIAKDCPEIEAYRMDKRFCSFGSNWGNKVPHSRYCIPVTQDADNIVLDLTECMVENGKLKFFYGILIKCVEQTMSYGVVATGDCLSFPIILEVRYKR